MMTVTPQIKLSCDKCILREPCLALMQEGKAILPDKEEPSCLISAVVQTHLEFIGEMETLLADEFDALEETRALALEDAQYLQEYATELQRREEDIEYMEEEIDIQQTDLMIKSQVRSWDTTNEFPPFGDSSRDDNSRNATVCPKHLDYCDILEQWIEGEIERADLNMACAKLCGRQDDE